MIILLTGVILSLSGSDRFFDSDLFDVWWQGAVEQELPIHRKEEYRSYLNKMRLEKDPERAYLYFTGAELDFSQFIGEVTEETFKEKLLQAHEETEHIPDCVKKDDNPNFDYYLAGNVPFVTARYKQAKILRMPNVTGIDNKINQEFLDYLEALKQLGKTHLYVNVMSKLSGEVQAKKIDALHAIEDEALTIVTLDKDSNFYWQKGEWESIECADQWKKIFVERLFCCSKTNWWPPKLKNQFWKNKIRKIIDKVHSQHFNSKNKLSQQDRLAFVEIAYLRLVQSLVLELNPDFLSITCKQSIDRGPTLLALLLLDQEVPDYKKILGTLIWQPVYFRNRPAHLERLERFLQAFDILKE